jgi:hypothetical protein
VSEKSVSLTSVCWVTSASVAALLCFLQMGAMASLVVGVPDLLCRWMS